MGLYVDPKSPFWYMCLEGYGRKRESTGIRRDARSAEIRKILKEQAEDVYHARMVQLARQKVGLPPASSIPFVKFVDWYKTHHAAKHRSQARTLVIIERLTQHFGTFALTEIKPPRWTEYETARLKDGVKPSTIARELTTMKAILNAAVGEHLEVNPLVHVRRKVPRLPAKRTLTKVDEDRLIAELALHHRAVKRADGKIPHGDDELLDIYLVAVGTLLRQENVVTLRRRQLQGARLVAMTKTGPHQVTLDGPTMLQRRAAMVLKRRLPKTADGYFFPKWAGRFEKDRNAASAKLLQGFRRACKRAGIPWGLSEHGVVWHTATRASGATRMLREHGVDIRTVQLLGGWSSLDQMAAYLGIDLAPRSSGLARRRVGSKRL